MAALALSPSQSSPQSRSSAAGRRRRRRRDRHHRLGLRRRREHGAVRRARARDRDRRTIAQRQQGRARTKLKLITCNTQGNKPAIAKACAAKLLAQGADIIMTTCDVDYAAPVVQDVDQRGKLTVAACIGTDQMGPKRFGPKGRLAFSFGNVAQDEGSAMAEFAWKQGLAERVARDGHGDRLLPQRRPGVQGPLAAARRQDRHRGDVPVARAATRRRGRTPSRV